VDGTGDDHLTQLAGQVMELGPEEGTQADWGTVHNLIGDLELTFDC
jgi:hypothetical protein